MRSGTLALAFVLLLTAGCLSLSEDDAGPSEVEPTATPNEADPEADDTAQTDEPGPLERRPSWIPGEWWTVEVTSTLTDEPIEWKRVVAGFTEDAYLVGQPAEQAAPAPLLLHVPGMGEVDQTNLSYTVHGDTFTPLRFPLEDGKTWQTRFEGDPVNATVETDGDLARVHFCCSRNITLTYDPDIRAIRELDVDDGFLHYEVRDHGFAHEGTVEVPLEREIVFFEGRVTGALGARQPAGPPAGVAEVPESFDHVAFNQIVGNLDATPAPETGVYQEQAHLPNGATVATQQAASTEGLKISFHETANATGTWRFGHLAAGPGLALTEGIGYQLLERELG